MGPVRASARNRTADRRVARAVLQPTLRTGAAGAPRPSGRFAAFVPGRKDEGCYMLAAALLIAAAKVETSV